MLAYGRPISELRTLSDILGFLRINQTSFESSRNVLPRPDLLALGKPDFLHVPLQRTRQSTLLPRPVKLRSAQSEHFENK
jgi:hypothetical protein